MNTSQLIDKLKENGQDFEFYPTKKEMIQAIYNNTKREGSTWLDIGAGSCNFAKYFNQISLSSDGSYYQKPSISQYYAIEKSKILVDNFDEDTICIGRDFDDVYLIDKPVDYIFCNPPYSDFENWTERIIFEGNYQQAVFLVIPERWKNSEKINNAIKNAHCTATVIYSGDFMNAERNARAKVDVVKIAKDRYYRDDTGFNENAFEKFFNDFFGTDCSDNKTKLDVEKEEKERISNQIINSNESKASVLVRLYEEERLRLFNSFKSISQIPWSVLDDIGVDKNKIKNALKFKISGLKAKYWQFVFDEIEEITNRLTSDTRNELMNKFKNIKLIDFSLENIYPIILWVAKNSSKYYDSQLIEFFKKLSSPENIKQYKSNKRAFETYEYRSSRKTFRNREEVSHYVLDYRIIMTSIFRRFRDGFELDYNDTHALKDIFVIARNLGFEVDEKFSLPEDYGKEAIIYLKSGEEFMRYRIYMNRNMHVKFNQEFTKAMNVEVSRLLGWIKRKEDIKLEFPKNLAQNAEKYFKQNFTCFNADTNKVLMLEMLGE